MIWDNVLNSKEQKAVVRDFLQGAVAAALLIAFEPASTAYRRRYEGA